LATKLRLRYPTWDFPHLAPWIHRKGSDAADTSQRSRSFLFASLGVAFAAVLRIPRVELPDNGIVSINIPINDQLTGALASRSTHPRFLALFNELATTVFDD